MAEWLSELSVGDWYVLAGEPFEIVGLDPAEELIQVQHYDGIIEEFDFDTWLALQAKPCAPPADYAGALGMDRDDYDGLQSDAEALHATDPLGSIDKLD